MNLIALYGPPAAGKLTITKELVRITGYTRFDTHRIVDIVADFFAFETEEHVSLLRQLQLDVFRAAAAADRPGIVWTFLYEPGAELPFYEELVRIVTGTGGRVCVTLLRCNEEELLQRVNNPSRQVGAKLTSPEILRTLLPRYGSEVEVPFGERLTIDTDTIPAADAARRIAAHFRLP